MEWLGTLVLFAGFCIVAILTYDAQKKRQKKRRTVCVVLLCLIAAAPSGGRFLQAKYEEAKQSRILYENPQAGFGFLIPKGYRENPFHIETKTGADESLLIHFYMPEGDALLFSFWYLDRREWEEEIRENFSIAHEVIYQDGGHILLKISVSDVQVDPQDTVKQQEYEKLLHLQEEVCDSFYRIE